MPRQRKSSKGQEALEDVDDDDCPAWGKSKAKRLLSEQIIAGIVTDDMDWKQVYSSNDVYTATSRRKFYGRLHGLRGQIRDAKQRASADEKGLRHDRRQFPTPKTNHRGKPRWEGSDADKWLKEDVKAGVHKHNRPSQLYRTRDAYQEFPLAVFCKHVYQEVRFQKFCTWRHDTKKPKANEWM